MKTASLIDACHPKYKKVVIVAMSGNMLINFSGPADVFTNANLFLLESGTEAGYDVSIVSPTESKIIKTPTGMEIRCTHSAMDLQIPIDTLIIAGNHLSEFEGESYAPFFNWLAGVNERNTRRTGSVCGGAFALAKAGLLNGRKATTHWDLSDKLRKRFPLVQVDTNPFVTTDGNIYTSGGVSSGIDLALAMVEEDYGKDLAIKVARKLVFYLNRPGYQAQFGDLLPMYESTNIAGKLQDWFKEHLHEPMDVSRIADHLNMSRRNFTRVFHKQTGLPPAKFIEKLRIETARKYLENTDTNIEIIADKCGLGSMVSMRRTFFRHLMITPSDYRRAFRSSLTTPSIEDFV
ncbi:GlxA family transcriptional regulator [Mucilaginibacter sp. cycad4]|uniref:GlxA family transcriptional regulator n=1 Tax=Mucilaginibacter sp. cycad4 TaxID=3342096 RepID=UPI002AAAC3A5|nr:GlxA family transcriptional regulator [Mucilaginibacter gossypii]WPU99166.1 GlxA family transcriptional regulator [Mucilaginibacter gossypii]